MSAGRRHGRQAIAELRSSRSSRAVGAQRGHQRVHQEPVHPGQRGDRRSGTLDQGRQIPGRFELARRMTGQQGVQRGGQGEHVTRLGGSSRGERLRRCVGRGHPQRVGRRRLGTDDGGQPEVGQSGAAEAVDQDVGGFHVTVEDAAGVQTGERIGHPHPHAQDLILGANALGIQPLGQRPAGTQLHDQVRSGIRQQTGVVDGDDPGMVGEPAGDARLSGEGLVDAGGEPRTIDLDRHRPGEQILASLPDQGETAPCEWAPAAQPTDHRMLHAQTPVSRCDAYPHAPIPTLNL